MKLELNSFALLIDFNWQLNIKASFNVIKRALTIHSISTAAICVQPLFKALQLTTTQ